MNKIPVELQPTIKTLLRAYGFSWGLTTVPGILGVIIKALLTKKNKFSAIQKAILISLPQVLKNSVTKNGFPFLFTTAVGGHKVLEYLIRKSNMFDKKQEKKLTAPSSTLFMSALLSVWFTRRFYPNIKTLDLTYFILARAIDVYAQKAYHSDAVRKRIPFWMLELGNVAAFMLACTEIIFSWFYEPERLPKSYEGWITKMSGIDERLKLALRAIRKGDWVYGKDTGLGNLLGDLCVERGLPKSMGDPLSGRIDCLIVHDGQPYGCEVHALSRFSKGFIRMFPVYLSVHLIPVLLFKRKQLLTNPNSTLLHTLKGTIRSSTFLGSFIGIIWYTICLVRTRIGHQLLGVNQTRLDDTLAPLLGSMMCGLSVLIETPHRRGEMTLFVIPRALYSFIDRLLSPYAKNRWWESAAARTVEDIMFSLSVMVVVRQMIYKDKTMVRSSVRGLMNWLLKDEIKYQEENDLDYSGHSTPVQEDIETKLGQK